MNYEKQKKREAELNYINMINVDTLSSSNEASQCKHEHKPSIDSFGTDEDFEEI